jgi:hypothetical protein
MPVIPVPERLRQEDHEFNLSLENIVSQGLKKKKKRLIRENVFHTVVGVLRSKFIKI